MKCAIGVAMFIVAAFVAVAQADSHQEEEAIIADALLAAPSSITERATVLDVQGNVVRQGSSGWACRPGPDLENGHNAMCNDAVFEKWMVARAAKSDFKTDRIGISYMLAGDEGSNTDPFAEAPTADNDWVVEGPHIMIFVPDPAMLEGISTDPDNGGPYVMWKGTPYAHIMIPVGER